MKNLIIIITIITSLTNLTFAQWISSPPYLYTTTDNIGIGIASPTSILHTIASGSQTANYTGNFLSNTATSSTASIIKYGLNVQSTGTWNGTSAINVGLNVNSTGGTTNYSALFSGGNVGVGTASPLSLLHLNIGSANPVHTRYTNSASTNGFRVGLDASGNGHTGTTSAN